MLAPWAMAMLLWFGGSAPIGQAGTPQNGAAGSAAAASQSTGSVASDQRGIAAELRDFAVRITSPRPADTVAGRIAVRAEVAADRPQAVQAVDFFIDGRLLFSDAEAPYELLWYPERAIDHVIEVRAYGPGRQVVSDVVETVASNPEPGLGGYGARVERVEVHVRVEDDDASGVPDRDAFVVLENDVDQPVVSVERVADLPLAVGLLIDHSESMLEQLDTALDAAGAFVDGLLTHPNDKAFVLGFADAPIVFQEFTNDSDRLAESIALIDTGNYTALYDSIVAAARRFTGIDGRRAAILLTDGADSGSDHRFEEAVAAAQRADVALYPVAVGLSSRYWRERWILNQLAERTGGKVFSLGRNGDPSQIYEAIEDDLRAQLRISYTPLIAGGGGEWRSIEVRLRGGENEGRRVRSRAGYFAR